MKWLPWSAESFAAAKKQGKPILLCIAASWCHWCHTMDRLAYADKAVLKLSARDFVAIRVDSDDRPDVNARYNVGGWPSTLVLAHDGEPVLAATYVPKERMVSFLQEGLARFSRHKPERIKPVQLRQVKVHPEKIREGVRTLYDKMNGGFGLEPKVPNADILEYLIYRCELRKDQEALGMLDHSLMAMLQGELFDRVQGGFFRSTALQNWTIVNYEKMLDVNAKLLLVYIRGFELLGRKEYLLAANQTLLFLFTVLFDKESGLFFGTQVADEGFCRLPLEKRAAVGGARVDKKFYTAANAAVALALFEAGRLEPEYRDLGVKLVHSLLDKLDGRVSHRVGSNGVCLLRDVVFLLMAVTGAFLVSKEARFLKEMKRLLLELARFEATAGGFSDVIPKKGELGRLRIQKLPVYENACAALVLKTVSGILRNPKYEETGRRALRAVSADAAAMDGYAATYAIALEEFR